MKRTQNSRFDDQDLIDLLLIYTTDYNKLPTQRDLLADERFPTHITFINRFGSLSKALERAGINNFSNRSIMHQMFKESSFFREIIAIKGVKVDEFVLLDGGIKVDFVFTYNDEIIGIIDLVAVSQLEGCPYKDRILYYRELMIDNYTDNYITIDNIFEDIYEFIEKLKEEIKLWCATWQEL